MYTFALDGCDRISKNHIEALTELEKEGRCTLVACCDPIAERAQAVAAKTGCPAYPSIDAMLDAVPCDVLSVCTPS